MSEDKVIFGGANDIQLDVNPSIAIALFWIDELSTWMVDPLTSSRSIRNRYKFKPNKRRFK